MRKLLTTFLAAIIVMALLPMAALAVGGDTEVDNATDLLNAVADSSGVTDIKLTADIDIGDNYLRFGRAFTLDLNGHTLTGTGENATNSVVYVSGAGNLTINDSANGGKVIATVENAVGVYGQVTINAGRFEGAYAALYNYYFSDTMCGTSNINGGTFVGEGDGAILNCGSMQISGIPVITGTIGSGLDSSGALTINGRPVITAGNDYALIIRDGSDAPGVAGSGTTTVEIGATLTIPSGLFMYVAGTLNIDGTLNNSGTVELDGIIVNNGTINNSINVDSDWLADVTGTGTIQTKDFLNSEVAANADIAYMIVITPSVDFGTIDRSMVTQIKDFVVAVEDALIEDGASISVENTTTDMNMKDKDGAGSELLAFTLAQPGGLFTFVQADLTNGEQSITSSVSCEPSELDAAGSYKGYMTFEVSYNSMD